MGRKFLSTPSARRATPFQKPVKPIAQISIHALREEGDARRARRWPLHRGFLSTPSARRATPVPFLFCFTQLFLSTPSARRATRSLLCSFLSVTLFLSTPSARRATGDVGRLHSCADISIHALREEGDLASTSFRSQNLEFLSTPSARRATCQDFHGFTSLVISIHALREEGDSKNRDKISIFKQIIQHSARI